MESKYNIENFERFLREKTDEFRMYPSRRVWYSIYNNMHPGNRLPSISMSIFFIFALLLIGYLHTDPNSQLINYGHFSLLQTRRAQPVVDYTAPFNKGIVSTSGITIQQKALVHNSSLSQYSSVGAGIAIKPAIHFNDYTGHTDIIKLPSAAPEHLVNNKALDRIAPIDNILPLAPINIPEQHTGTDLSLAAKNNILNDQPVIDNYPSTNNTGLNIPAASATEEIDAALPVNSNKNKTKSKISKIIILSEADKAWMEDFVMYNMPLPKKWAGKVSMLVYITPSVVYRSLKNNAAGKLPANNNGIFNNSNIDNVVNHSPSFGLETGFALQYDILRRIKLKAGVQLNYARYNAHGFENYHPVATSLTMSNNDYESAYESFRATPYSNGYGLTPVNLHNESYQVSLPVGADIRLASIDNIQWYIGASIQPTIIVYGKSYLISTDRRNYVQDPSMLNRFNLNAGFETYLSYKTNNYIWQFGPQFRSQIFSTNTKTYSVEERLHNYGFKVGISRKL